jgi:hypothetical protein
VENSKFVRAKLFGGEISNEPRFKIALSKEALKYYAKISVNTAEKLHKRLAVSGTMNFDCPIKDRVK